MSLRLIIEDDEGSTTIVPLGKDTITIGRQQGNTIQLTEKNVSRRHAQLLPEGETWILEDLGSYNGVKVNGRAANGRVVLQEGDVVQIGDYHLALTEDVDRRSLNYDRGRAAANDGAVEPMLASSSTNLPQLSPQALAALSSGQHPAQVTVVPAPSFIDSGQMPMVARTAAPREEPKSRAGMMVLGLAVIGGLALGGFWWMTRPPGTTSNASAKADSGKETPTKTTDTKPTPPVPDTKVPLVADTKIEPVPPPDTKIEPVPTPDVKIDPPIEDDPPEVVPDEPDPTPPPPKPKGTPDKPKPKPTPPPPKPTPPPEPAVDADALLADARKQLLKSPATAFDLATKSYNAKKSASAAFVIANAACKMKDAGKAKKAIGRLKGQSRDEAISICSSNGITIE